MERPLAGFAGDPGGRQAGPEAMTSNARVRCSFCCRAVAKFRSLSRGQPRLDDEKGPPQEDSSQGLRSHDDDSDVGRAAAPFDRTDREKENLKTRRIPVSQFNGRVLNHLRRPTYHSVIIAVSPRNARNHHRRRAIHLKRSTGLGTECGVTRTGNDIPQCKLANLMLGPTAVLADECSSTMTRGGRRGQRWPVEIR